MRHGKGTGEGATIVDVEYGIREPDGGGAA